MAADVTLTLGLVPDQFKHAFNSSPVPDDFFDQYPVTLPQEELDEIIFNIADIHDPVSNTDENGDFYLNARHITQLFQFNFDAMEVFPTQSFDFTDLRFDRHSITKLIGNAQRLIALYQSGW